MFPTILPSINKVAAAASLVATLYVQVAWAQEPAEPELVFNGFGTLGVVHSDESRADFVGNILTPDGAGHTEDWSARVDSRLGLQLTANMTSRLSAVGQIIVEQRYDGSYKPTLEWANISFDVTPDFSVRVGRSVLPTFMVSEYRKVGYASPWVRPPQEVYSLVPVTNSDGIGITYRSDLGAFDNTLQVVVGRKDAKLPDGGEIKTRNGLTVANTLERGPATFVMSYSSTRLRLDTLDPLFAGFRAFGPEGEAIADRYDVDDKRFQILSAGVRYDPGDWFVMSEWARIESRTTFGDSNGWYITGGYRSGALTPYLTLGGLRVTSGKSHPGLNIPQAQGLNEALNALLGDAAEQNSIALGARWDVVRNTALKVQLDYMDLEDGSSGVLVNEQPDFSPGGTVVLFSATLDVVF